MGKEEEAGIKDFLFFNLHTCQSKFHGNIHAVYTQYENGCLACSEASH